MDKYAICTWMSAVSGEFKHKSIYQAKISAINIYHGGMTERELRLFFFLRFLVI